MIRRSRRREVLALDALCRISPQRATATASAGRSDTRRRAEACVRKMLSVLYDVKSASSLTVVNAYQLQRFDDGMDDPHP